MKKAYLLIFLGLVLFSPGMSTQHLNVSGDWDFQMHNFFLSENWGVTFQQDGALLEVTMMNRENKVIYGQGSIVGNSVTWYIHLKIFFGLLVRFRGTVAGNSMIGIFEVGNLSDGLQGSKRGIPATSGHNAGEDCFQCHTNYQAAGTVFADETAAEFQPDVPVSLIKTDGNVVVLENTNADGNIASPLVPEGMYLVRLANIVSRTWHKFPGQGSCSVCHIKSGNTTATRDEIFHKHHSRVPPDNDCTHCHHYPASMSIDRLKTGGVLNTGTQQPTPPGSQVDILGQVFFLDPTEFNIQTVRPDIFAEGFFSMFDAILAVAKRNGILEEIQRETNQGHVIPSVRIQINPSSYRGNPVESHRITVSRDFIDVKVTPHNVRSVGFPSPDSKPFQPGVVTSLDILLSLMDQGYLNLVTSVFYTYFAQKYIHSHYVVAMGFPGVGIAHSSGRQGFVYTTNNGSYNRLPNNADRKFHMTSDICVVHAPDFSYWRWAELGDPYYESVEPNSALLQATVVEDYEAISRGFNLHQPRLFLDENMVQVSFNIFEPGNASLKVYDSSGKMIKTLFRGRIENAGIQSYSWRPSRHSEGELCVLMEYEGHTQVRTISVR